MLIVSELNYTLTSGIKSTTLLSNYVVQRSVHAELMLFCNGWYDWKKWSERPLLLDKSGAIIKARWFKKRCRKKGKKNALYFCLFSVYLPLLSCLVIYLEPPWSCYLFKLSPCRASSLCQSVFVPSCQAFRHSSPRLVFLAIMTLVLLAPFSFLVGLDHLEPAVMSSPPTHPLDSLSIMAFHPVFL